MNPEKLPIGYWLKQADQLLTRGIDEIHSSFGLTRSHWQRLHSLAEYSSVGKAEILNLTKPFLNQEETTIRINDLKKDQFVNEENSNLYLTKKGLYQHNLCLEKQKSFREKAMQGITQENYLTTISTLQKIIENIK